MERQSVQVGEFREHPSSLPDISGGVTLLRHDWANRQPSGQVRVSAPYEHVEAWRDQCLAEPAFLARSADARIGEPVAGLSSS